MNHYFEDDDSPIQVTKKSGFFSETNLKLIAGTLTVIGGSLSFLGQHPKGYWVFIALAAVIFGWIFVPPAIALVKRFLFWRSNKRYVIREFPRLKRFYDRLLVFTSRDDTRGFRNMLFNSSTSQNPVIITIIGFDYIPTWIQCYAEQLKTPPKSVHEFLRLCHEFTAIVAEFNRNYVIKAQQGLEKTPFQQDFIQDHFINGFEQCREDFVHYLREVEDWMNSVYAEAERRVSNLFQNPQTLPIRIFERPGSFRAKKATGQ